MYTAGAPAGITFLNSSFFAISQVTVEGNQQVTKETIMDNLNIVEGTNMFRYLLNNWKADHTMDPKIDTADVYLNWPNAITVQVTERTTVGYVPHMGTYLCVDKMGMCLTAHIIWRRSFPSCRACESRATDWGKC
ncbi:MAG: cell division protein FtsQ/DivIB [Clostridia bacterium]